MRKGFLALVLAILPATGQAVGPQPAPLSPPVEVTFGYQKVGHLAPIVTLSDELKKLGINLKLVEFVRYADARTALLAGSLDIATVGPADLAIALSQGSTNVTGLMGVGADAFSVDPSAADVASVLPPVPDGAAGELDLLLLQAMARLIATAASVGLNRDIAAPELLLT